MNRACKGSGSKLMFQPLNFYKNAEFLAESISTYMGFDLSIIHANGVGYSPELTNRFKSQAIIKRAEDGQFFCGRVTWL